MEKIVLIGAGSASFTRGLLADLIRWGQPLELALVDISPDALTVASRLARKMLDATGAAITLSATVDRRAALPGATAIICTVGVGGRRAWEQDVFIPRRFGIYQPVGDSVMPGGTSRALRMIPAMVAIARDVLELAPDALFFNYGNPMGPVCRAIRKATGAPVIGLCHGVQSVGRYLADVLETPAETLSFVPIGMNHLTWFTDIRVNGQSAMDRLRAIAASRLEKLRAGTQDVEALQPFSWQLFSLFDAFPAVLDRHVTEFFPQFFARGQYYGKTLGVDAYSFEGTIAGGDEIFAQMRVDAMSEAPLPADYFDRLLGEHEQVVEMIASLRAGDGRVFPVNLPNHGLVPEFPDESILESFAVIDADGLRQLPVPPVSPGIIGTLATRLAWVETVVDAALDGDRDAVAQALILDGAADTFDVASQLADALLAAQAAYLPQFPTITAA